MSRRISALEFGDRLAGLDRVFDPDGTNSPQQKAATGGFVALPYIAVGMWPLPLRPKSLKVYKQNTVKTVLVVLLLLAVLMKKPI